MAPCPSCGKTLDPSECTENKAIEKLIEKLPIKCKHEGCPFATFSSALQVHELNCDYAMSLCPNSELCGLLMKKCLPAHELQCAYRRVQCHSCEELLSLHELQSHLELYCPGVVVPCPHLCDQSFKRSQLAAHLVDDCPHALVGCPFGIHGCEQVVMRSQLEAHMREDVTKHLLMTTTLVERQQREIEKLRSKVQDLQPVQHVAPIVLNVEQVQHVIEQ